MASIGDTTRPEYIYDSATDTWIPVGIGPHSHTPAAIGAISSSVVTTKGDLIVATGSGTVVRQGVGVDGSMLVADSSQTDGVNYALGNAFAAGKNKIINGDMGVWQRGTTFSNPSSGQYFADRINCFLSGTGQTRTVSQQVFTPGTAPVAGYEGKYFLRYNQSVSGTSPLNVLKTSYIEDVQTFAGQTVTFSYWAKVGTAGGHGAIILYQVFGSGGSGTVTTTIAATPSYTTDWVRYSYTFTVPSIAGKTIGTGSYINIDLNLPSTGTFTFDIWGLQWEAGSVATPFQTATGTIQGELAACQRYYEQTFVTSPTESSNKVSAYSDSNYTQGTRWKVTKRVAPSVTVYSSNGGTANRIRQISTNVNYTPGSISDIGIDGFNIFTGIAQSNMMDFHYTASAEL